MPQNVYDLWKNKAKSIPFSGDSNWKRSREVNYMLEHVIPEFGDIYYHMLLKEFSESEIQEICKVNDSVGYTTQPPFPTPSSLRYLYHANEILKNNKYPNLLEVGCGYGGLIVILNKLCKLRNITSIKKVNLVDLPEVQVLQKWYLSKFNLIFDVEFLDSSNFCSDLKEDVFLVSNYALGEFTDDIKDRYLDNIIPKLLGGYLLWNSKSTTNRFPTYRKEISEIPQTDVLSKLNKVISF